VRPGDEPQQAQPLYAQFAGSGPSAAHKKAIIAVAASILSIAYYLLRNQAPYPDLGAFYFTRAIRGARRNAWRAESKSSVTKSRFAKQLDGVSFLVVGHGALARLPCPTTL
jgi:hypothetical protein